MHKAYKPPSRSGLLAPALPKDFQEDVYKVIIIFESGRVRRGSGAIINGLRSRCASLVNAIIREKSKGTLDLRRDLYARYFTLSIVLCDLFSASSDLSKVRRFNTGEIGLYQELAYLSRTAKELQKVAEKIGWP